MPTHKERNQLVSWLALILSLVALFVSINNANQFRNVLSTNRQVLNQLTDLEVKNISTALEKSTIRLETLKTRINTNQRIVSLDLEIEQLNQDINQALDNSTSLSAEEKTAVKQDLEKLSQQLKDQSAGAITSIDNILTVLKKELTTEQR